MTDRTSISQRALAVQPSATLAITNLANQLRAEGKPVIGYGAGEPDFPTPDHIVEAALAAVRDVRNHKYSPAPGLPELREAVAALYPGAGPDNVLVTVGAAEANYIATRTLLAPGDRIGDDLGDRPQVDPVGQFGVLHPAVDSAQRRDHRFAKGWF